MNTDAIQCADIAGKYLTFALGDESYGIPVLKVREIIRLVPITIVPQMPDYIKGVINLRGKIIPVVDLRSKFGMVSVKTTERTCIVVVQVNAGKDKTLHMGVVVDAVEEVLNITAGDIEDIPEFSTLVDAENVHGVAYILGMAKIKAGVKMLLDIDRVLTGEETCKLVTAASA